MRRTALAASLLLAVLGAGLLYAYMEKFEADVSGGAPVDILIATQPIAIGEVLSEGLIGRRSIPSSFVEKRHILADDAKRVLGIRVSTPVEAQDSILWSDLAMAGSSSRTLSELVPDGKRAVTVAAGTQSTFGGLLRPGDRIDVFLTAPEADGQLKTRLLLERLLVLAVGSQTGRKSKQESRRRSEVSLATTMHEASLLATAGRLGNLTLVLRNPVDIATVDNVPVVRANDILQRAAPAARTSSSRRTPDGPTGPTEVETSLGRRRRR